MWRLKESLLGGVKLFEKTYPDKYVHTGYGFGFDSRSLFLLPDGSMGKNAFIFGADMSSFVDKIKDISILVEVPTQELDDTILTAEAKFPINFTQSGKRFVLSLHYNRSNSVLFVNATKICQFKAKGSDIKKYLLSFRNISGHFSANNMTKQD